MKLKFKIILLILFFFGSISFAQTEYKINLDYKVKQLPFGLSQKVPVPKPEIAYALSGGGSRGLAQIGVIKAFEDAGIYPDVIIGTSMGSVVGGLYSAGYSIEELDSIAVHTDWNEILSFDNGEDRRELFVDQKITEDKAIFTFRLKGLSPVLPTSFNDGQKLSNYLNLLTFQSPIPVTDRFENLRFKFKAVSTNLVTGDPVILDSGSLSRAMRASSSVSFFLSPVKEDSILLVDGGLVANIPVDIARENGGEFVIAVNSTSDLHSADELELPWLIADQVVSIPMKLLNRQQLNNSDAVVQPDLNQFSSAEFDNIRELIDKGYSDSKLKAKEIKSRIDSVYNKNLADENKQFNNLKVSVEYNGSYDKIFNDLFNQGSTSLQKIRKELYELLESGDYDSISANVIEHKNYSILKIKLLENPAIKKISYEGITLIDSSKIDSIFHPLLNKPFNDYHIYKKIIKLIRIYRKKGYSLAELNNLNFNKENGTLEISVDEGKISEVRIAGNYITGSTVVLREFPISAGDYFMYRDVQQGLINIRSTNLFEDVVLSVKKNDNQNVLILDVVEKAASLVRLGMSIDNEDKLQFSFDIRNENLFGTGTELGLLLYGGVRNRGYILEHKSNRIFNTYLTYKVKAYYKFDDVLNYSFEDLTSERRFSRVQQGEYRQIYYGTTLGVGAQVERLGNLIVEGKYEMNELKNLELTPINPEKFKIVSLKVKSTIDTQDKFPFPTGGVFFSGFYETAQEVLGSDIGFTNLGFEYKNYLTINDVHTFSPSIRMGFADKTLPLSYHYSIGGQNSFFGMREDEFRGRQIFVTSLTYRLKLPFKIFFDTYTGFRYDLGSIWDVQEQIRFKDFRHGLGVNLSFDTPIGPADFSIGRSFIFKESDSGTIVSRGDILFYFSIGYAY